MAFFRTTTPGQLAGDFESDGSVPFTGDPDLNGNALILDADGDTSISEFTDDDVILDLNGPGIRFRNPGGTGNAQFRMIPTTGNDCQIVLVDGSASGEPRVQLAYDEAISGFRVLTYDTGGTLTGDVRVDPDTGEWDFGGASITNAVSNINAITCRAYRNGSQTLTTAIADSVTLDTFAWNQGTFSLSGGAINVPTGEAGYYQISGSIGYAANGTGDRFCGLYLNGGVINGNWAAPAPGQASVMNVTTVYYIDEGDAVTLRGLQFSGGNLAVVTDHTSTNLTLAKLGN